MVSNALYHSRLVDRSKSPHSRLAGTVGINNAICN